MHRMTLLALGAGMIVTGCTQDHGPRGVSSYAVTRCAPDGTCADGTVCRDDLCLAACAADSDCPADGICLDGECFSERGAACTADAECAAAEACVAGVCGALPPTLACAADADCPAGASCADGECVADPTLGCDRTLPERCGDGVDNDCDGAVDEGCDPTACTSDADCPVRELCCAGACANPLSSATHCGGCGLSCAMGESCEGGVCGGACDPAPEACGDRIDNDCDGLVDEGCDPVSCGDGTACAAGLICCGGGCADLESDPSNCGTCGAVCAMGTTCVSGVCTGGGPACAADADCGPGELCSAGVCVSACDPTVPERCGDRVDNDCDGLVDEGC